MPDVTALGLMALDWGPIAVAGIGGAGATVAAAGAWIGVRRQRSGSVATSTSAELWEFNDRLLDRFEQTVVRQAERIAVLEAVLEEMRVEREEWRKKITELEMDVMHLKQGGSGGG